MVRAPSARALLGGLGLVALAVVGVVYLSSPAALPNVLPESAGALHNLSV
jgi:hypothetical protein